MNFLGPDLVWAGAGAGACQQRLTSTFKIVTAVCWSWIKGGSAPWEQMEAGGGLQPSLGVMGWCRDARPESRPAGGQINVLTALQNQRLARQPDV